MFDNRLKLGKMLYRWSQFFLAVSLGVSLAACGGGGSEPVGGGGGVPDPVPPVPVNTCASIGLQQPAASLQKIYNGVECLFNEKSPVVVLETHSALGGYFLCSGTLITPTRVLTAGHCVQNIVSMTVYYGAQNGSKESRLANRWAAYTDGLAGVNPLDSIDVAVVVLESPINVPTLPLLVSAIPQVGDVAAIYGFGGVDSVGTGLGVLRAGAMKVTSVDDSYIYALHDGSLSNTCLGDSGGPLVATIGGQTGVVGVVSGGTASDCTKEDLSSFTKLQNELALDFIKLQAPDVSLR